LYFGSPFPLTPALSLRERVTSLAVPAEKHAAGFVNTLAVILPLPEGEGRGEGEGAIDRDGRTKNEMFPGPGFATTKVRRKSSGGHCLKCSHLIRIEIVHG